MNVANPFVNDNRHRPGKGNIGNDPTRGKNEDQDLVIGKGHPHMKNAIRPRVKRSDRRPPGIARGPRLVKEGTITTTGEKNVRDQSRGVEKGAEAGRDLVSVMVKKETSKMN